MQPDPDDLVGPEPIPPSPNGSSRSVQCQGMLRAGAAKSRLADQRRYRQSSSMHQPAPRLLLGNRLLHDALLSSEAGNAHVDEHRPHTG